MLQNELICFSETDNLTEKKSRQAKKKKKVIGVSFPSDCDHHMVMHELAGGWVRFVGTRLFLCMYLHMCMSLLLHNVSFGK